MKFHYYTWREKGHRSRASNQDNGGERSRENHRQWEAVLTLPTFGGAAGGLSYFMCILTLKLVCTDPTEDNLYVDN